MDTKLMEILASGLLIMLGTLAGAITQHRLQRKREFERTIVELRMEHYSALCGAVIAFNDVFDDSCISVTREQRYSNDPPAIYRIRPKKSLQEVKEVVLQIQVASAKAYLVASSTLANEFRSFRSVSAKLVELMREAQNPMDFETTDDGLNSLWVWDTVLSDMKLELGIARPTDWDKVQKDIHGGADTEKIMDVHYR